MTTQHTPGPWTTDGGAYVQAMYMPGGDLKPFYHTVARTDQPLVAPGQISANARLIAAAPDLLDLAKKISLMLPSAEGLGGNAPIDAFLALAPEVRSAIAKATGGN